MIFLRLSGKFSQGSGYRMEGIKKRKKNFITRILPPLRNEARNLMALIRPLFGNESETAFNGLSLDSTPNEK